VCRSSRGDHRPGMPAALMAARNWRRTLVASSWWPSRVANTGPVVRPSRCCSWARATVARSGRPRVRRERGVWCRRWRGRIARLRCWRRAGEWQRGRLGRGVPIAGRGLLRCGCRGTAADGVPFLRSGEGLSSDSRARLYRLWVLAGVFRSPTPVCGRAQAEGSGTGRRRGQLARRTLAAVRMPDYGQADRRLWLLDDRQLARCASPPDPTQARLACSVTAAHR
jgi:hypothetical protein